MVDGRIERGSATRERLISAARELFGERGFEGTSIVAILEGADVARGALYHHFATKEALFDAVLERTVAELASSAADAARPAEDPRTGLQAGLATWLELALDPATQRIALIDPPSVVGWQRVRELDEQHTLGGVRASLRAIADRGGLPAADVDVLALMLEAAVAEAALLIANADDPSRAKAEVTSALETLLGRLLEPAAAR